MQQDKGKAVARQTAEHTPGPSRLRVREKSGASHEINPPIIVAHSSRYEFSEVRWMSKNGFVAQGRKVPRGFRSKDGRYPEEIIIAGGEFPEMQLAHEMGHVLTSKYLSFRMTRTAHIRSEVMAWRVAKSYCKPELWSDAFAIACLQTYWSILPWLCGEKFRSIIPLNGGPLTARDSTGA